MGRQQSQKSPRNNTDANVLIGGGGLAGLSMACLLGKHGVRTALIERADLGTMLAQSYDGRTTAISSGSKAVFEQAGIWDDIAPYGCPITDIDILDSGSAPLLKFHSAEIKADAFGWIFENRDLRRVLYDRLKGLTCVEIISPAAMTSHDISDDGVRTTLADGSTISTQLLIGADGRQSFIRRTSEIGTRQWSYKQEAIICNIAHDHPHDGLAVEHFRPEGPFAVLPMHDNPQSKRPRSSIVWTVPRGLKPHPKDMKRSVFTAALQARMPDSYGDIEVLTDPMAYPLGLIHAYRYTAQRTALIADAAHGIHPIAGQGLNLGFRDILALSDLITGAQARNEDIGADMLLKTYERARRTDNMAMAGATDILNHLFGIKLPPVRLARKLGLRAVNALPPVRRFFMKQAMGN